MLTCVDCGVWCSEVSKLGLLTAMKVIYAANVADSELATGNAMVEKVQTHTISWLHRRDRAERRVRLMCVWYDCVCARFVRWQRRRELVWWWCRHR